MKSGMEESICIESGPNNSNLLLSFGAVRAFRPSQSRVSILSAALEVVLSIRSFSPHLATGIVGSVTRPVRISTHLVTHLESPSVE